MSSPRIEIIARGLALRENHVLLCQNLEAGHLYLPGGHVEFGEAASAALAREFAEETGLDATIGHPLLISEQTFTQQGVPRHEINLVFHVEQLGEQTPETVPSREPDIAFAWVDLAALPDLAVLPPEIKAWLVSGGVSDRQAGWLSACSPG